MANLGIFAIVLLVFLLTRGRQEGTARFDGMSFGMTCARIGRRFGLLVFAYRPNRVYWRLGLAGG